MSLDERIKQFHRIVSDLCYTFIRDAVDSDAACEIWTETAKTHELDGWYPLDLIDSETKLGVCPELVRNHMGFDIPDVKCSIVWYYPRLGTLVYAQFKLTVGNMNANVLVPSRLVQIMIDDKTNMWRFA